MMCWKGMELSGHGLFLDTIYMFAWNDEGTLKIPSQNIFPLDLDFNLIPPKKKKKK